MIFTENLLEDKKVTNVRKVISLPVRGATKLPPGHSHGTLRHHVIDFFVSGVGDGEWVTDRLSSTATWSAPRGFF